MAQTHQFVDLHIHIGRTATGKAVKITGAHSLTLHQILEEAALRKGMDMVGIIDCHVPEVQAELKQLIRSHEAYPLQGGGVRYGHTTLILGTEMEIYDENCRGPIHVLCYFPTLEHMSRFSSWMSKHQKNIHLSSQRSYVSAEKLQHKVKSLDGLFVPAHIFTPHKSVYGKGVQRSLTEILNLDLVDAVELGLSSDTEMAKNIPELDAFTFLTNSDAHSLPKIAREYQVMELNEPDFQHLGLALAGEKEQRIVANYGLDPELGKYHQEVTARLKELQDEWKLVSSVMRGIAVHKPPYIHQVPLEFIPGLGPKGLRKLLQAFGTEMNVIHRSSKEELDKWVKPSVSQMILAARDGRTKFQAGGAGKYGKVSYSRQA